jgi:hypothetical protein
VISLIKPIELIHTSAFATKTLNHIHSHLIINNHEPAQVIVILLIRGWWIETSGLGVYVGERVLDLFNLSWGSIG